MQICRHWVRETANGVTCIVTRELKSFMYEFKLRATTQYNLTKLYSNNCKYIISLKLIVWATFTGVDWKWRTWKWRTIKIAGHEFAGHQNAMRVFPLATGKRLNTLRSQSATIRISIGWVWVDTTGQQEMHWCLKFPRHFAATACNFLLKMKTMTTKLVATVPQTRLVWTAGGITTAPLAVSTTTRLRNGIGRKSQWWAKVN